jgi:hypothetical protein
MTDSKSGQDDDRREDPPAAPQAGVLGNLPRTRPSVRSPRRPDAPDPAADAARAAAASRPPQEPAPAREPTAEEGGNELEALAKTGVAVATGAATLGLRLAGRAAQAVRDAVERR